jgi:hypothetical protein
MSLPDRFGGVPPMRVTPIGTVVEPDQPAPALHTARNSPPGAWVITQS